MSENDEVAVVLSFTPVVRQKFELVLPEEGDYIEAFNSDRVEYGGSGLVNRGVLTAVKGEDGICRLSPDLPPLGAVIIKKATQKKLK